MIPSIRTFLLINLLLSITLITSFIIIATVFLGHEEIQDYMDAQLISKTINLQDLVEGYLHSPSTLTQLQTRINHQEKEGQHIFVEKKFSNYTDIQFQLWNQQQQTLLRSLRIPNIQPVTFSAGFSDHWFNGEKWRLYTSIDKKEGTTLVVAEKYNLRNILETHITRDSILIILISYPFLGILIWLIVGHGLNSLKKIAAEVRYRELTYLEPVNVAAVPTEIKPIIDEINELFERLKEAYAREKRFAADAAHELRTPLAGLKAQAQVAQKATTEEERQDALQKVIAGVNRSAHVVHQLLVLSRMVPEGQQGEAIPIHLEKQAAEVIADLVPEALLKNTDIELEAPASLTPILGHPIAIGILLRNLIDNAIRYTPPNSAVQVIVKEDEQHVILQVIDNGPGIPEELRERVFERFFRVLGNKTTGSGLGLGIVQQVAVLHHATINLDTPPNGQGLQVTVTFQKADYDTKKMNGINL